MEQNIYRADRRWTRFHAVSVFLIICFYMLCPPIPQRWAALYNSYGKIFIISVCALYFWHMRCRGFAEIRLVLFYTAWFLITRILNGDSYLQNEFDLFISRVLCFIVLASGMILDSDARKKFFDAVIAVYCGYFFIACLIAIYCVIFGCYIIFPPEATVFGLEDPWSFRTLNSTYMFETIRTISTVWTYVAWCLMTYEFAACKNRYWRIPIAVAWFVFYLAIALSYSRTIIFAASVNIAMLAVLLVLRLLKTRKTAVKALAVAAIFAFGFAIGYGSFNVTRIACGIVSDAVLELPDREREGFIHYHPLEEYYEKEEHFTDPRDIQQSASNLSGRSDIYKAVLPTLRRNPMLLLKGSYSFKLMNEVLRYMQPTDYPNPHTHNFLIQTLLLTGLLGFLAVLSFSILVTLRAVRVFFADDNSSAAMADRLLTLPIAGLFIYSMTDILMFTNVADARSLGTDLRELMFFLIAGIFLARSYEIFPEKKYFITRKEHHNA